MTFFTNCQILRGHNLSSSAHELSVARYRTIHDIIKPGCLVAYMEPVSLISMLSFCQPNQNTRAHVPDVSEEENDFLLYYDHEDYTVTCNPQASQEKAS
eukprot:g204.t1